MYTACDIVLFGAVTEFLPINKTSMRSRMGNEKVSGLARLDIHRDIQIYISDVIETFSRMHPRKLRLSYLFEEYTYFDIFTFGQL